MPTTKFKAILFDLDGTLLDTAADLANALNLLCQQYQKRSYSTEEIKTCVNFGSPGLIKHAFGIGKEHPQYQALSTQLLKNYENAIADKTTFFAGADKLLQHLSKINMPWGIVTNKPKRYTDSLLQKIEFTYKPQCVISGDTLPFSKPHPAPLLHASKLINLPSSECLYIGDAERDIIAAKAAKMKSLVALYGYINNHHEVSSWGADGVINSLDEVINYL